MVRVRVFNAAGQLVGPLEVPRIERSPEEWQAILTPEQHRVLRSQGTERPFCGLLLDNKQQGVYTCAGCGLPLFASDSKFNSGTGWPSFFQPIAKENVAERPDYSHGTTRTEINCARCDGHLGHVFPDGPPPTGLRYCLNSESLQFTPSDQTASLADPAAAPDAPAAKAERAKPSELRAPEGAHSVAVLAGGCFWCTEAAFEQIDGVHDVVSGYVGGAAETANYHRVCEGDTGHAEAIRIEFDPQQISYEKLLDIFFDAHDPTQLNQQGADIGTQYRSAIFPVTDEQRHAAEAKIADLNQRNVFGRPVVTTIEPFTEFFVAEDHHQNYARANPHQPYIASVSMPKVCKIREKYRDLVR